MRRAIKSVIFCCFFLLLFIQCNKSSDFGNELLGGNIFEHFEYELDDFQAISVLEDSVRTFVKNGTNLSSFLIGNYDDPVFGKVESKMFTAFFLNNILPNSDGLAKFQVDSIIWSVRYNTDTTNFIGDLSAPISLDVFQITEPFSSKTDIYSNYEANIDPTPVASLLNFVPKFLPKDSSYLRFKMEQSFLDFLKNSPDSTFSNSQKLNDYFYGLSIQARDKTKSIISLSSSNSVLSIYYKDLKNPSQTLKVIDMLTSGSTIRWAYFNHDYSNSQIETYLNNPDADSLLYIKSMSGTQVKIQMPDLADYKGSIINKASIEFTVADPQNEKNLPEQLLIYKKNSTGSLELIKDAYLNLTNVSRFGGSLESFVENGNTVKKYTFNIGFYLTDYMNGSEDGQLFIGIANQSTEPTRLIVKGSSSIKNPIKLRLTVTKI